jgi:hypothetical protein
VNLQSTDKNQDRILGYISIYQSQAIITAIIRLTTEFSLTLFLLFLLIKLFFLKEKFGYDNRPHHAHISTFPHHKHTGEVLDQDTAYPADIHPVNLV